MIKIYTDGSSRKDGAGFGLCIMDDDDIIEIISQQVYAATNNQMELLAICFAIKWINENVEERQRIEIYTDSAYALNSILNWCQGWFRNNWCKSDGKQIENLEIMQWLHDNYYRDFFNSYVSIVKVKGHDEILGNEIADAAATGNINKLEKLTSECS